MVEKYPDTLRSAEAEAVVMREALKRGVHQVLPDFTSLEIQMKERSIKLYLGIDPTSPNLHIGHTVPLRKLRHFQELGHEVILLFGTFTGMIGDPSDKTAARVRLTPEQIETNVATYAKQANRILDLSPDAPNPITIAYNHEWLEKMNFAEVVELMSNFSVQQMLERSMFQKRIEEKKPIWLHELSYPLMQGWDAVALGVDLEVGGKDQIFNMLVGRTLVKRELDKEKWVMATKLIEDPEGRKMGKTEGDLVNIMDWPEWKYEAIMHWPDAAIPLGFELLTSVPLEQAYIVQELLQEGKINPMDLKMALAYRVVAELDGPQAAKYAEEEFDLVLRRRQLPRRMHEIKVPRNQTLDEVLVSSGLVDNANEALVKIAQGAIYVNGQRVKAKTVTKKGVTKSSFIWQEKEGTLQIGKRTIKNIRKVTTE